MIRFVLPDAGGRLALVALVAGCAARVASQPPPPAAPVVEVPIASVAPPASAPPTPPPPTPPPPADDPEEPTGVVGSMWGRDDSVGAGGLGLSGVGDGGIGLGSLGTTGMRRDAGAATRSLSLRQGTTTVTGRLPPEVIQRIVRQNFGRFRLCYENGLLKNPKLKGRVATKFVIDASGKVTSATREASTDLTDGNVVDCVRRAFLNLSFPQPEGGGSVVVVYPVIFNPGD